MTSATQSSIDGLLNSSPMILDNCARSSASYIIAKESPCAAERMIPNIRSGTQVVLPRSSGNHRSMGYLALKDWEPTVLPVRTSAGGGPDMLCARMIPIRRSLTGNA